MSCCWHGRRLSSCNHIASARQTIIPSKPELFLENQFAIKYFVSIVGTINEFQSRCVHETLNSEAATV